MTRRIVITGLGVVSPFGCGVEKLWDGLTLLPVDPIEHHGGGPAEGWNDRRPAAFVGQIDEFGDLPAGVRKQLAKSLKVMNRETQLGVAAGWQALCDSAVVGAYAPEQIGITFGAGNVCLSPDDFLAGVKQCEDSQGHMNLSQWGSRGISEVAPLWLLRCLPNMPACHLSILADLRGPNNTITEQELGADLALAEACRVIRSGDADAMLVGGTGTTITGLNRLHAYWSNESESDAEPSSALPRQSTPAEGAAAIVLEELTSAVNRGARIYGEVLAAVSASAGRSRFSRGTSHSSSTMPRAAMSRAMKLALQRSRLQIADVGHLHLAQSVIPRLTEEDASDWSAPIVSARGRLGHAGAGSGAMELVASLLAIHRGELFESEWPSTTNPEHCSSASRMRKPAGDSFLKVSRCGLQQTSCVAVSRNVIE